jgi:hypothetical protein
MEVRAGGVGVDVRKSVAVTAIVGGAVGAAEVSADSGAQETSRMSGRQRAIRLLETTRLLMGAVYCNRGERGVKGSGVC